MKVSRAKYMQAKVVEHAIKIKIISPISQITP